MKIYCSITFSQTFYILHEKTMILIWSLYLIKHGWSILFGKYNVRLVSPRMMILEIQFMFFANKSPQKVH